MSSIGIIANPASGKDIRRLVAYGIVVDNMEKVDIVRQMISGSDSVGVDKILIMPDTFGIGYKALDGYYKKLSAQASLIEMPVTGTDIDSIRAAHIMNETGVECILTLGGDGTNRAVAKGCGDTPILPVAAGTNNVFPYMIEGTVAGIAAGLVAKKVIRGSDFLIRSKKLAVIKNSVYDDFALVDITVYDYPFKGSLALWDIWRIKQVMVAKGQPTRIGTSAIAGNFHPVKMSDERGIHIVLGKGNLKVKAPVAPGIVEDLMVERIEVFQLHDRIEVLKKPSILALDGEREVGALKKDQVEVELRRDGPLVVDFEKVLFEAVENSFFVTTE